MERRWWWLLRQHLRQVHPRRELGCELTKQQAKIPMSNHLQCARRRTGARHEEVQLQLSGPRPKTNMPVGVEVLQVVALDPVPAEDQVHTDVQSSISIGDTDSD